MHQMEVVCLPGCTLQVVQIFKGEVEPHGGAQPTVVPGYLWLYADSTFGIIFDTWEHNE